jgi:GntR family histidine utilization transcriptional repressor
MGMLSQPQPLYEQIKAHVLDRIADGTFRPGAKIPSENQLANELGTSRLTAHRALRELTTSGVLERINGVGTFVAQPRASSTFVLLHNIADDIRKRGKALSINVRTLEKQPPPPDIAKKMGVKPKEKIFHSVIIYAADGSPIQLEDRYVAPDFAPQYLSQDFTTRSTTDYLQIIAFPTRTEHEIQSLLPSAFEAECLDLEVGDPCLVVSRKTWVGQMLTTFTRFVHPGARHSFVTQESLEERR